MVGPDHHHRHRRHHRPAPHGLGRLGGALDRRGERHRASASTRPKYVLLDREGRGLDALQRGQVLEAQELHHRPGRRPAAARRAAARAAAAPRAEAAGLRAGRQRPLGLLHLQRDEAGLDQPRLRVDAHGGARRALRRPLVLRQGQVPAARRTSRSRWTTATTTAPSRCSPTRGSRRRTGSARSRRWCAAGFKFELEALSRRGISFITEEYLPKKLAKRDWLV